MRRELLLNLSREQKRITETNSAFFNLSEAQIYGPASDAKDHGHKTFRIMTNI